MPTQILSYRVDLWLNKKTNEALYGIGVRVKGVRKWMRVCDNNSACIYDTRAEAEAEIKKMKSERDKNGFKKPRAAAA